MGIHGLLLPPFNKRRASDGVVYCCRFVGAFRVERVQMIVAIASAALVAFLSAVLKV